jgi:hypothetical protein
MSGTSIGRSGEQFTSRNKSRTKKPGRVCKDSGCNVVLSIYNDTDRCSIHSEMKPPRTRGKTFY